MISPSARTPRLRSRRGFALLVTIVLVAFLVLILVGLATFTRVETQVAANSQQLAAARQNALMALNIAVGQLQQAAGPDQRVTARADILDTASTALRTTVVKQPLWTGVWLANNPGAGANNLLDAGPSPSLRTWSTANPTTTSSRVAWLVSGVRTPVSTSTTDTPVDNSSINPASWTATATNSVELGKNLGPGLNINVAAPLVDIGSNNVPGLAGNQTIGRYAYWVSDEGIKAKINLSDPTIGVSETTETGQAHFLAPQANAMHKVSGLVTGAGTDFRTANSAAQISGLLNLNQVKFLPTTPSALNMKALSQDVTPHSKGVLANVRNGGLKKDLTAAFESTAAYATLAANHGYGASMLYRNDPSLTFPSPTGLAMSGTTDGLPWLGLYSYYNTYKASTAVPSGVPTAGSPRTPTTSGSLTSLPLVLNPRVVSTTLTGNVVKLGGIVPEVIASRLDIAISSYYDSGAGLWKLRLYYYPQLVLYNPYNCRISAADFQYQRNFGAFATAGTAVNVTVNVGATSVPPVTLNQSAAGRFVLKTDVGQAAILEPGETRVFGLAADASTANPLAAITFNALSSSPTLSPDWAQYCDLPGFAGTANPADVVNVTISDRRLRAQNTDTFTVPNNVKWPGNDGTVRYQGGDGADISGAATTWPAGLAISGITSPRRLTGYFYRKKGLLNSSTAVTYANGSSVTAPYHGNAPLFSPFDNKSGITWGEIYISSFGTLYSSATTEVQQIQRTPGSYWETYYGDGSAGVPGTLSRRVLRDVPNQPLVSLGQFMHMPVGVFNSIGNYQYRDLGSMFVGGSLANPFIPTTANLVNNTTSGTGSYMMMDDSFLANEALFDRFYFSTVPPAGASAPQLWADFNTANPGSGSLADASKPLLNNRLRPYYANGAAPQLSDLRDFDRAAANLMLDGAFNINSTSVEAWKALLSSLSGNNLRLYASESGSATSLSAAALDNPIPRFWSSANTGGVNLAWEGVRSLSDAQVTELATRIVEQVKARGPFLSLSDFLNRRLGASGALTRAGALQTAIDTTSPDINSAIKASGADVNASGLGMLDAGRSLPVVNTQDGAGNTLKSTVGMPGYLMQQDLVQAFSPAMSARSDTFVIRTYGEAVNPATGDSSGKAWAEAVVQRLPEYVNASADQPHVFPPTDTTNQTFGRRFKVVSFRWLSPDDL